MTAHPPSDGQQPWQPEGHWRTRDIVITAVIGVAFGVVFWAWGLAWSTFDALFLFLPPAKNLLYAVWFMPAILAPLIVRKPGAAVFAEVVAAGVSMLVGSQWGIDTLLGGFLQGAAAEGVFAVLRYRHFSLPALIAASLACAVAAWLHDWVLYYANVSTTTQLVVGAMMVVSAVVIAGLGSHLLARALRRAGVLGGFPT